MREWFRRLFRSRRARVCEQLDRTLAAVDRAEASLDRLEAGVHRASDELFDGIGRACEKFKDDLEESHARWTADADASIEEFERWREAQWRAHFGDELYDRLLALDGEDRKHGV